MLNRAVRWTLGMGLAHSVTLPAGKAQAQQKIAIDLDDGVKRNYPLFAGALKPIKGLEAVDD